MYFNLSLLVYTYIHLNLFPIVEKLLVFVPNQRQVIFICQTLQLLAKHAISSTYIFVISRDSLLVPKRFKTLGAIANPVLSSPYQKQLSFYCCV